MARAPFTRFCRSLPITVKSWLAAGEAASSSPNASVAASAFRVHCAGTIEIEADGFNADSPRKSARAVGLVSSGQDTQ